MRDDEMQVLRVGAYEGGAPFIEHLRKVGMSEYSLQLIGDGLLREAHAGTPGAAELARECRRRLDVRGWDGDRELSEALAGAVGDGPVPALRPLAIDLEELAFVLESGPDHFSTSSARIDLTNGDVLTGSSFDYLVETGEVPGDEDEEAEDEEDRWLFVDPLGSRSAYRDMEWFIGQQSDPQLQARLERAISGRGAFRHFKDVLADVGLLDQWYEIDNDSQRGRARRWLADEGYTPVWRERGD